MTEQRTNTNPQPEMRGRKMQRDGESKYKKSWTILRVRHFEKNVKIDYDKMYSVYMTDQRANTSPQLEMRGRLIQCDGESRYGEARYIRVQYYENVKIDYDKLYSVYSTDQRANTSPQPEMRGV